MSESPPKKKPLVRAARIAGGSTLLTLGVIGWILPVIPGWPLVIPGLVLLAEEFHWARLTLDRVKKLRPKKSEKK